jgi:hypothetical protein
MLQTVTLPQEIQELIDVKSSFVDYKKFQDDETDREEQRDLFAEGEIEFPVYRYPELEKLLDNTGFASKMDETANAATKLLLESHKYADASNTPLWAICALESGKHLRNLNKMKLVQGAEIMLHTGDFEQFMKYNSILHGLPTLATFQIALQPETIFSEALMTQLSDFVHERWGDTLAVAPNTPDDVMYNAQRIVDVLNDALKVKGWDAEGWQSEISKTHTAVATNGSKKRIFIPENRVMNAATLRGRVAHEIGIHAGRVRTGSKTGYKVLRTGTANYLENEEGLAIIMECGAAGSWNNEGINRARNRYITAGLIAGIDRDEPRNSREVLDELTGNYGIAVPEALTHLDNAFRGTDWSRPGVFYSKLQIYFSGLVQNIQYLADAENLDMAVDFALTGKFDHIGEEANIVQTLLQV